MTRFWVHLGQISLNIFTGVKFHLIVLSPSGRDITPQASKDRVMNDEVHISVVRIPLYRENSKIGNYHPPANLYYFIYEPARRGQFPIFEFSLYVPNNYGETSIIRNRSITYIMYGVIGK